MHSPILAALLLAAALAPMSGLAAQASPAANPASPDAPVSPPAYESAFTGYRNFQDEKPASWREVNDEAGRIGGHLGIFGGAGHAGHGGGKTVTNTLPPTAARPQTPSPAHGPGHQGMQK